MSFFNCEMTIEVLNFSVEAILSLLLLKEYNKIVSYIKCLKEVTAKGENKELEDIQNGEKRYVMVHGPVKALGNNIPSIYVANTFGVVQKTSTNAPVMAWNSSGYWCDKSRQSYNVVPFAIIAGKHVIEVQDILLADELYLDTVYNKYDRTLHSLAGNLWSFFAGVPQTTEEMLKEGTVITGVGELTALQDGSKTLLPPGGNKPYLVTTKSISTLLKQLKYVKVYYGGLLLMTGSLTVILGSMLVWRLWKNLKKRKEKYDMQRRLEASRRTWRQNARNTDTDLPDTLRCIVCLENPKQVIMLPCGHLCACEDCSIRLGSTCPICRAHIVTKTAVFLS